MVVHGCCEVDLELRHEKSSGETKRSRASSQGEITHSQDDIVSFAADVLIEIVRRCTVFAGFVPVLGKQQITVHEDERVGYSAKPDGVAVLFTAVEDLYERKDGRI